MSTGTRTSAAITSAFLSRVRGVQDLRDRRWCRTGPQGHDDSRRYQRQREQECSRADANVHAERKDGRNDDGDCGEPVSEKVVARDVFQQGLTLLRVVPE